MRVLFTKIIAGGQATAHWQTDDETYVVVECMCTRRLLTKLLYEVRGTLALARAYSLARESSILQLAFSGRIVYTRYIYVGVIYVNAPPRAYNYHGNY